MDKADLREQLRARRAARQPAERAAAAAGIEAHGLVLARDRATVAAFVPVGDEPGHGRLLDALHEAGTTVLLPVLRDDLDLDWAAYRPGGLAPGRVRPRLREPDGPTLGRLAISAAGLVLVPALAVARDGTRLGFGAGSYDRALSRAAGGPQVTVAAVVHADEVLATLPREGHDVIVGWALTPVGLVALDASAASS